MSNREKVLAHLREAVRSIETATDSTKTHDDAAQVRRYIFDAIDRLNRADAVAKAWELAA